MLFVSIWTAQASKKLPVKQVVPELTKFLTGTDLPFKIINDSVAVIPYEGENIPSYQVVLQKISDLYIIYTNLSDAMLGKLGEAQYKFLLQRNDEFDFIKIGLADDDTFYLRADIYKSIATTAIIKRMISQVANVTNIMAGSLK